MKRATLGTALAAVLVTGGLARGQETRVEMFAPHEIKLKGEGNYTNPYVEKVAEVLLREPGGGTRKLPMFWDGGKDWKFRFAPDKTGRWSWKVTSSDSGLNGKSGWFEVTASKRAGSIEPMKNFPLHFQRLNGEPFWFMGDTAWALYTDNEKEKHDCGAAERYIDARAVQGFNVVHSMLLSEAGWGNSGGMPFTEIGEERINPGYWQEVDRRLAYANSKGIVCGLALAWGNKRNVEPFAWGKFPSIAARRRYARYIAARYGAYEVYFIVAGEWHAEIRDRSEESARREFIEIGNELRVADPHRRMIAIHPMTEHGSVREFNEAEWMSFGDYQQNYGRLHERVLESRKFNKPVVNSEYGYFLRDQSGDSVPDKENSTSIETMRHATWDIAMAGGYVVTGFGTTYFGGNRDPGPFDLDAAKNRSWEGQMGHLKKFFTGLEWWKLKPHDELIRCKTPRGADSKHLGRIAPPETTYWCLAEPGKQYVVYTRGLSEPVTIEAAAELSATLFNPRSGERTDIKTEFTNGRVLVRPPDGADWIAVLRPKGAPLPP